MEKINEENKKIWDQRYNRESNKEEDGVYQVDENGISAAEPLNDDEEQMLFDAIFEIICNAVNERKYKIWTEFRPLVDGITKEPIKLFDVVFILDNAFSYPKGLAVVTKIENDSDNNKILTLKYIDADTEEVEELNYAIYEEKEVLDYEFNENN